MTGHPRFGERIGPYELVELLGEGGMGQVYLARQREPIRRDVALKLIKWGMDTRKVVARFELERQTLALMEHPSIARVLDAGATDDGRPYFVMEFVAGVPVTEYCNLNRLSTAERLGLFVDVCEAVQHAHQRGIIHRDLKPSNVLVERVHDRATAKIIDFGVAKATARQEVQESAFTEQGQLIGTPEYMSPEQARFGESQIDTRTDIYSLGVLLYELLVGVLPFDSASLRAAGLGEIYRILREEEPPRPSTRLSTLGADSGATAEQRRTTPRTLLSQLRGDLDQIVMKAMDKDRSRRYASASEFAADVRRFLRQEPVLATPASLGYRSRKFARRNRGLVAGIAAVTLALALGITASSLQAIRATRAEAEARKQAELVTRTRDYLLTVFDQANPAVNPLGREMTIQEALDRASLEIGGRFEDEPELSAAVLQTVGEAFDAMGEYARAEELARTALEELQGAGRDWSATALAARLTLARAQLHQGQFVQSRTTLDEVIARPDFASLSASWRGLYLQQLAAAEERLGDWARADALLREAIELLGRDAADARSLAVARRDHAGLLRLMGRRAEAELVIRDLLADTGPGDEDLYERTALRGELARLLLQAGEDDEALALATEVLRDQERVLGPRHFLVAQSHAGLATLHVEAHRLEPAMEHADLAIELFTASVGPRHKSTYSARNTRANVLASQGHNEEALVAHRELLADQILARGEDHPDVILARTNLHVLLMRMGKLDEAGENLEVAISNGERVLGPTHPIVLTARSHRADYLDTRGDFDAARECYESLIADAEGDPNIGRHHPEVLPAIGELGLLLGKLGEFEAAVLLIEEALEVQSARYPLGHGDIQKGWNNLGTVRQSQGDLDGAAEAYARSLEVGESVLGAGHPDLTVMRNNLASIERSRGNHAGAEQLFALVIEEFRAAHGDNHINVYAAQHNHGYTLIFLDRLDEAEAELQAASTGLAGLLPPTHLYCQIFRSSLGLCHARQGKFELAEEELRAAYEQVVSQLGEEHPRARKIAGYVVENYELWGRESEAGQWRALADEGP